MVATRSTRPKLLVLADVIAADTLRDLFGHRGFVVAPLGSQADLKRHVLHSDVAPEVAVLDFRHPQAERTCAALRIHCPSTVVIGVVDEEQAALVQDDLDAAFCPPVDRALLFVRVIELVAARRHGGHTIAKITGVVGVIRGNPLFQRALTVLNQFVPPVNAGAVLERALHEIGARPETLTEPDLAAILASGRLFEALSPFGNGDDAGLRATLATLASLLETRSGREDPCIPVRVEEETTARTCG